MTNNNIHASLYPNVAPHVEQNEEDKFFKGTIIIKIDSGPGRNCKIWVSVKFQREMHLKGVLLLPCLPNSMSVTQEMDDLFTTFKSLCKANTKLLFAAWTLERSLKIKNGEETEAGNPPVVASLCNDDLSLVVKGDETRDNPKERQFNYC